MSDSWHTISGFGTASRNLATYLHKVGHDVSYLGWQTFGQQVVGSFHEEILSFKGYPNVGGQKFGEMAWKYWLPRLNPDLFLTVGDFWMLLDLFKQNEVPYPWLMWYPIDGYPITDQIESMLKKIHYRVAISEYGAKMVRERGFSTGMIPHGLKTQVFKPYKDARVNEMKRRLGIPLNAFVIGRVDRNQKRKKIPRTIKAFLPFKKDFPDSVLLLWMDKKDHEGWDLDFIIKRFGLKPGVDVIFPPPDMMANFMYGVGEQDLAAMMNCIDIHLWLTGGEGFGLTGLETMGCGAVNVATDYTTPSWLFDEWKCGLPVKVETFEVGNAGVDRALADPMDAYGKMKYLKENPDELKVLRDNGIRRAQTVFPWDKVTKDFDLWIRDNVV